MFLYFSLYVELLPNLRFKHKDYFAIFILGIIVCLCFFPQFPTIYSAGGVVVAVIVLDLQLPMQSVSITTKVVSWNPVHGKVSLIH